MIAGIVLLAGCVLDSDNLSTTPASPPEGVAEWEILADGLERRIYRPDGNFLGQLHVLRIDPSRYTFRVHYRPSDPRDIANWESELTNVTAFVNANFFDTQARALGLLVADGQVFGDSYRDRGGTFLVQNGKPLLRSNLESPYAGEPLEQAIQAFPMLVYEGEAVYNARESEPVSRRTVIAQDRSGRVLLMATPLLGLSLAALSTYLPTTDMDLLHVLNLDGGGSSMMFYQASAGAVRVSLPSLDPVPAVLAVYAR